MNKFVIAFPLPVSVEEEFSLTESFSIAPDAQKVMIPGCTISFDVVRRDAVPELSEIFSEHRELSLEEKKLVESHKSLMFLVGMLKNVEDLRMVNNAILKFLAAGAMGVYMQHSGAAWTAEAFREELDDAEFPMDPWINFLENEDSLYTLGLETFALPDLCISRLNGSSDELRNILSVVADSLFVDGVSSKSGTEVDGGDVGVFSLRAEAKSPFPKDAPEFNRQGLMRLMKK